MRVERIMENKIKLFEDKKIRVAWDQEKQDWYFSVVDVISALVEKDYQTSRKYWNKLNQRLREEGFESVTFCHQLKLEASDGKKYLTTVSNAEGLLRIIQSIPSKKAEPFKQWLAMVGNERLNEISDPELAMQRGMDYYKKKGYSDECVYQRLLSIKIRHELTDEWKSRGVSTSKEYAILTDEMCKAWSDMTISEYKEFKGLHKESLRDNMSNLELVLTMLSEASTKEFSKVIKPENFDENIDVAKMGGQVARKARKEIEDRTKKPLIESRNAIEEKKYDS